MKTTKLFYRCNEVCEIMTFSKSTLYREIKNNGFPAPIKIGDKSRWFVEDIEQYIRCLKASAVFAKAA